MKQPTGRRHSHLLSPSVHDLDLPPARNPPSGQTAVLLQLRLLFFIPQRLGLGPEGRKGNYKLELLKPTGSRETYIVQLSFRAVFSSCSTIYPNG